MSDDIIRMAREASTTPWCYMPTTLAELERFAELVRKDYSTTHANLWLDRIHKFMLEEREACARVAERSESAHHCAAAIRARGQA